MRETRSMFDFLRARGEEFFNQISTELMNNAAFMKAMQTAMRGKERLDEAVAQALKTMNVPTRTEFKRALARIEALESEVSGLKQAAARKPRPPRPRPRAARKTPSASSE